MTRRLCTFALCASAAGVAVLALAALLPEARAVAVRPMVFFEGAVAGLLFIRMFFDARLVRGANAATRQIPADAAPAGGRFRLLDPQWGLWGRRLGPPASRIVSALGGGAFLLTLILVDEDHVDLLLLAMSCFAVAVLVTIIHIASTTSPDPYG